MSNKKFFTLIYGDQIHAAPKAKIIPAESFSVLQEAGEILEHIKNDAESYRMEIVKECERLKENAHKEGYEAGFKLWAEHLTRLENEAKKISDETQKAIVPIALKAAQKMVAKELELSPDTIMDIVESNLKAVATHKRVVIYVNKNDLEILEKNKPKLKELFESLEAFSVRERADVETGGCVIETEVGIINAQLKHRWNILEKAFENLMKSSPEKVAEKKEKEEK